MNTGKGGLTLNSIHGKPRSCPSNVLSLSPLLISHKIICPSLLAVYIVLGFSPLRSVVVESGQGCVCIIVIRLDVTRGGSHCCCGYHHRCGGWNRTRSCGSGSRSLNQWQYVAVCQIFCSDKPWRFGGLNLFKVQSIFFLAATVKAVWNNYNTS
jgi:hypothetical protein